MTQLSPAPSRPRTWLVVLMTAGVMTAIGVAFVIGVLVGAAITRGSGGADASPASPGGGGDQSTAPGDDASGTIDPDAEAGQAVTGIDDCLVGTWEGTEHSEDWRTEQGAAQLSGLSRTMTFSADGTQTITYDADQATITTDQAEMEARFDGEVVYRTSTSNGTMSFQLQSSEGTVTVEPGGVSKVEELKPGTGDVRYTCDETTLRQEADGYLSVYRRIG